MKGLERYFKKLKPTLPQENVIELEVETQSPIQESQRESIVEERQRQSPLQEIQNEVDITNLDSDPGKRVPIHLMTKNPIERENIRRRYLLKGPTQPVLKAFPQTLIYGYNRRFNPDWYEEFRAWLEYNESKDACYCLYCYLFNIEFGNSSHGHDAFVGTGFKCWNKPDRLRSHIGEHNSVHNACFQAGRDLMNRKKHIDITLMNITDQAKKDYRVRLKTSLSCVRFLLRNGLPFRGHDESESSSRKGLFLETLNFYARPNEEMWNVVLNNAPENNKMTF